LLEVSEFRSDGFWGGDGELSPFRSSGGGDGDFELCFEVRAIGFECFSGVPLLRMTLEGGEAIQRPPHMCLVPNLWRYIDIGFSIGPEIQVDFCGLVFALFLTCIFA
jgi:hypothetical protein